MKERNMANITGLETVVNGHGKSEVKTQRTKTTQTLGKMDFLKMLIAQLKNQDPLNPMSGTDFATQLAQFSSLEQLYNLNESLHTLSSYQWNQVNIQAANLIGKEVLAYGGNSFEAEGKPVDISFNLSGDSRTVKVSIFNSKGTLVDSITLQDQHAGVATVTWHGAVNTYGTHTFIVDAVGSDGKTVTTDTLFSGKVTAVSFRNHSVQLNVGGKEIDFTDVIQIKQS